MEDLFYRFGTALAIGLMIGIEREFRHADAGKHHLFAGARTFPLLALAGCAAGMVAEKAGSPIVLAAILLALGGLIVAAYVTTARSGRMGSTTEMAAGLTVLVGVLCFYGEVTLAAAIGVATLTLLMRKVELHRFSRTLTRDDLFSVAQLGLITVIVLPVLPSTPLGSAPFDTVSLHNVWLMVILVSGLGFLGYVLKRFVGQSKAIALTGFLGGLVSSTAVTLTFAQRSLERAELSNAFAIAIIIAWITMFIRVVVEVAVVNSSLVGQLWIPMTAAAAAGSVYCFFLRRAVTEPDEEEDVDVKSPFSLGKSLAFGLTYGVVLVVARAAQMYFGDEGIYISAVAAGLTDVDAITLSLAEMSKEGGSVSKDIAVQAITLAAMSNTLVKAGIVFTVADRQLKKTILPGFVAIVIAGLSAAFI